MPSNNTTAAHEVARQAYYQARDDFARWLERMAAESILELFENADSVVLQGEDNYDSGPVLRLQRILDRSENVLYDIEDPDGLEDQLRRSSMSSSTC